MAKKKKTKRLKPAVRLVLPPNKRHKTKKDYKRKKKPVKHELEN
jgi:hypothetical protein